jgi:hypothetical protein
METNHDKTKLVESAETRDDAKRKKELITIRTVDGSTITGNVHLGAADRVSDLVGDPGKAFIVLTDVTLQDGSRPVLFVNKAHIVWVEPNTTLWSNELKRPAVNV